MIAGLLKLLVHAYRYTLSPLLGPRCRHLPTCSEYCLEALEHHGAWRGAWLTLKRLSRCHPWGTAGIDPVPPRRP
ncbi:MAG: membrane protein insertion efficiency factor YidD [Gammaproteobacteria bacterium]